MSDYNISAEITANTKGFESGVKKAQTASKNLGKSISNVVKGFGKGGLTGALTSAGLALGGIGIAVGATVKAVKGLVKVLDDCSEAYKVQLNAERALDTAINNSPYVTGTASKRLKEFASEMQKVSNMGDEELIPFMTQLIASGRTEAETMKIIKTASDMASSGAMSFDTAVTQLNATLNGNIGRLGQQNAELKELSAEELKNGKAVDILANKYKGLTEATVDTKKQLKNAIGDLKESFGASFEQAMAPMRKFFTTLIQGWADARKAREEYEGARKAFEEGTATNNQLVLYYEQQLKYIADEKLMYEGMYGADKEYAEAHLKELELEENKYKSLVATIKYKIKLEEEGTQASKDTEDREQRIADLKDAYLKKIAEQEARWKNIKDVTGETVKAEEKIKFYEDSLVDLMTEAGGEITTNNQLFKDQMVIVERLRKTLQPEEKETSDVWAEKIREQAIARLEAEKEAYDQTVDLEKTTALQRYLVRKDYNDKIYALQREQLTYEMEKALKSVEGTANEYEEKARIVEYYNNEFETLAKKNTLVMEKEGKQAGTKFAEGFKKAVEIMKKIGVEIVKVIQGIANKIKGVFPKIKNIFEFDTDKALTNLLVFEDKILTFFVETLPKLPSFLASAMQSISVLIKNILSSGGFLNLGELLGSMLSNLINQIPQIIRNIIPVIKGIVSAILSTLSNMDIFGQLLDMIVDGFEWLLDSIVSALPTILKGLVSFVEKVAKKLPQIIKVVIPALSKVIVSIVKVLPSLLKAVLPNVLRAVLELVKELLKETPVIVKEILNAMPEIISAVIEGITEFLSNLTAKDIATFVSGVINAVIQIASSLIKNIGKIVVELIPLMAQIIIELIKSVPDIIEGLGTGVWEGAQDLGETIWNGIKGAGEAIKDVGKSIGNGLKKLFGFATGTQSAPRGLALVGEAGPELVRFNGGEQVLNTRNTQKALAGAGGNTNNFNVVFNNLQDTSAYAMMSQLRAYNRQMAINGVI